VVALLRAIVAGGLGADGRDSREGSFTKKGEECRNGPIESGDAVRSERTMKAPPERVVNAFLDPDPMRPWMTPGEFVIHRPTGVAKVGWRTMVAHSRKGVSSGGLQREVVKIVPHGELVYRWPLSGRNR
jgi:uncharacterized protein YndB with AHSA1/START domain